MRKQRKSKCSFIQKSGEKEDIKSWSCKERKNALSLRILESNLRIWAFKHRRHASGRFHYTVGSTLTETLMPRNVTVSMKTHVSLRSAWQFMET